MKTISAAFKAFLAQPDQTTATCWLITRRDAQVFGFTDHDQDILFNSQNYISVTGYTASSNQTTATLAVDNLEVIGILNSPAITEDSLRAGLWDFAAIEIFDVNYADLTMGKMDERTGWIGEVVAMRGFFKAELRGLMQAYSRVIGHLTSPLCRADLGDSKCQVDLTPFTVTSTITGVNPDLVTLYDTARSEPGPPGGVAITGITNANPGIVTMADASLALVNGQPVTLSGIVGPSLLNVVTIAHNPSGTTFSLGIDTSDTAVYPVYVGSGLVTPFGDSGYFDFGVITFTSGLNAGFSMEVKSYLPGQITLPLPMPYAVAVADAYSMHAGCDKFFLTCKTRFNNVVNFRGEPYIPGMDKLVQVGRSQ